MTDDDQSISSACEGNITVNDVHDHTLPSGLLDIASNDTALPSPPFNSTEIQIKNAAQDLRNIAELNDVSPLNLNTNHLGLNMNEAAFDMPIDLTAIDALPLANTSNNNDLSSVLPTFPLNSTTDSTINQIENAANNLRNNNFVQSKYLIKDFGLKIYLET